MPNCRIIIHRHSGLGGLSLPPSAFAAKKLAPILEGKAGEPINLIHDRIPGMPMSEKLIADFEKMIGMRAILRTWKKFDRDWRGWTKRNLRKADDGVESEALMMSHSPDARLILETNRETPGRIVNLPGHYPFEAAVENTEFLVMMSRALAKAQNNEMAAAATLMRKANEAHASCNLLRDFELVLQISQMGKDVVVFRDLSHSYLAALDQYEIPVAVDRMRVMNFADFVRMKGITIEADAEPAQMSFSEESINLFCSGTEFSQGVHGRLALLQILLMGIIKLPDMPPGAEDKVRSAHSLALQTLQMIPGAFA